MYTGLPIYGVRDWIWWGSMPQCLEKLGLQYGGHLRNICIHWRRALRCLELFAIWELKTTFHDPTVHMRLATCLCLTLLPLSLRASGPLQDSGMGSCKDSPLTLACHFPVAQTIQTHIQYLYIGAGMVFGIIQQCDFCCVLVLGNWKNLDTFRLTDNPLAA